MALNLCLSIVGVPRGGSHPNGSIIYPPLTTPYDTSSQPPHRKLRDQPSTEGGDGRRPEFAPPSGNPYYSRKGEAGPAAGAFGHV